MAKFEKWGIGDGQSYLYTEDLEFGKWLLRRMGRAATYEKEGKVFAYQFLVFTSTLMNLTAEYGKKHPLVDNDLRAAA